MLLLQTSANIHVISYDVPANLFCFPSIHPALCSPMYKLKQTPRTIWEGGDYKGPKIIPTSPPHPQLHALNTQLLTKTFPLNCQLTPGLNLS